MKPLSFATLSLLATLFLQPAAAATFYSSAADFSAAAPTATSVPLSNIGGVGGANPVVAGPMTITPNGGGAFNLISGTAGLEGTFGSDFAPAIAGHDLAVSGPENIAISFASAVAGFAFEVLEPSNRSGASRFAMRPALTQRFRWMSSAV